MTIKVRQIEESDIPAASRFLLAGFSAPLNDAFAAPDVLRWKCFDPRGGLEIPCGFVATENGQIVAYEGLCATRFVGSRLAYTVSAGHGIDWLAAKQAFAAGLMVAQRSDESVDVQFSIGGSAIAIKIKKKLGWINRSVPEYYRVLRPSLYLRKPESKASWKQLAKIARGYSRWLLHPRRELTEHIELRRVDSFGDEVTQIVNACNMQEIHSLRTPELLNHFLRYPRKNITGWHLIKDGQVRGFALLSVVQHGNVRTGRIADCFLDCLDLHLWQAAIYALTDQLARQSADMAACYGTTPWMAKILKCNGFYCQRLSPFMIQDRKKLLPEAASFYLTHLEADHAYL